MTSPKLIDIAEEGKEVPAKMVPAIYGAVSAVMDELSAIGKDSENKGQGFMFRGIDAVYNELHPLMAKHKIFTVPRVLDLMARKERETRSGATLAFTLLRIEYDFISGIDGSKLTVGPIIGEGMDAGDKGTNKAMAIAHKYALFQLFLIPTEKSDDPDKDAYSLKPERKKPAPVGTSSMDKSPPAKPAATAPDANGIASDELRIASVSDATAIADDLMRMAEGLKGNKDALTKFWISNKRPLIALRTDFTEQYVKVETHFKSLA